MKKWIAIFCLVVLCSCGGNDFQKSPVDNLIRDLGDAKMFSIILYDMDVEGNFFKDYKHQYKVIKTTSDTTTETVTDWVEVREDFFEKNIDNMGMEIAAKGEDGKLTKTAAPPGYSSYVGNSQYGHWTQRNGTSFWEFYGQYMFMSSMFNMMAYPVRRSYYDDYRGGYYGRRAYYGPTTSGKPMYGTGSDYSHKTRPGSRWNNNPRASSFRQRVKNSVSRSRSSSRYSGSRSRSRGGGFGK